MHTAIELVLICHVTGVRVDSFIDSDSTSCLLDLFKMLVHDFVNFEAKFCLLYFEIYQ